MGSARADHDLEPSGKIFSRSEAELEVERATREIQRGGSAHESLADAYNARGMARAALGDYDDAIDDYDAALVFNPGEPIYYNNRGNAFAHLK